MRAHCNQTVACTGATVFLSVQNGLLRDRMRVCSSAQNKESSTQKRHRVHPIVSTRFLKGQFYILYEDLRNCRGKYFTYFRMSIESFDKLLLLVGPRVTYENTRLRLSVPPQERLTVKLREENTYFQLITVFQISLSVRYTNKIEVTKFEQKNEKNKLSLQMGF